MTTGVAKRPFGSMSSTAVRRASELSASTVRTTGAPASTSARVVRLRSATAQASTANTSSAHATVTMAISRRSAGRRAICRPASAQGSRPRRSASRASGPAVGMVAWASSSPPAMASRPGASSAIGPPSPVSRVATPAAAAATTAPSTRPTCRVDERGGTRRSSEVSGWRRLGVLAATMASRPATREPPTAAASGHRASGTTPGCSQSRVATQAVSQPSAVPSTAPASTSTPSSRISMTPAPSVPWPRSRASAISGRRCSVAAAQTNASTTMPRTASCTASSGITVRAWSRWVVVESSSGPIRLVALAPRVPAWASTAAVADRTVGTESRSIRSARSGMSRWERSSGQRCDARVAQAVKTSSMVRADCCSALGLAAVGAWPRPAQYGAETSTAS